MSNVMQPLCDEFSSALLGMTLAFLNWSLRCLDQFTFCTIIDFLTVNAECGIVCSTISCVWCGNKNLFRNLASQVGAYAYVH